MKPVWKKTGNVLLSGALAFCALTLFSMLYANTPAHHADPDGATDYRWDPDTFYSQAREGLSFGRTNNEGYYCLRDYHAGDPVDILVMGSSHMEASNVQTGQSAAALLDNMLEDKTVYNIGTSAHMFLVCAGNLDRAVEKYQPRDYVVLETDRLVFSNEELESVLNGTMEDIPSVEGGPAAILQKNQYLRLLYRQLQTKTAGNASGLSGLSALWNRLRGENAPAAAGTAAESSGKDTAGDEAENERLLREVLSGLRSACEASNAKPIVFFHPSTTVYEDGQLHLEYFDDEIAHFEKLCGESGVIFLSMTGRFTAEYESDHVVAYGFSNTPVCTGHLNEHGHAMIAEELYKLIREEP